MKWYGYDDSYNSWENDEDLDCPELIEDFCLPAKKQRQPTASFRKPLETTDTVELGKPMQSVQLGKSVGASAKKGEGRQLYRPISVGLRDHVKHPFSIDALKAELESNVEV